MIRSETNAKMDLEGHYPQNTILHCITSNGTKITLHFFQGQISAMPEIIAGLFLGNIKDWNGFVNVVIFKRVTIFGSQLAKV